MSEEFDHLEARLEALEYDIGKAHIFTCALANLLCKQGVVNADILQSQSERLQDPEMISNADLQFMLPKARWLFLDKLAPLIEALAGHVQSIDLPATVHDRPGGDE